MEILSVKLPLKGQILRKIGLRFPEINIDAIEALTTVQAVAKAVSTIMNEPLSAVGLTEGRCFILLFLLSEEIVENDHPSPSEIAEHIGVTRATITGLLDGLERDGFIERHHDSQDRRALSICMTTKGREFMDSYAPVQGKVIDDLFAPLTRDETRMLIALLGKIDLGPHDVLLSSSDT